MIPARTAGRWAAALLALMLVAGGSAGCSSDDEPASEKSSDAPEAPVAEPVTTVVKQGTVAGVIGPEGRLRVRRDVAAVVDGWIDGGWVAAAYPTTKFPDAFENFTPGTAKLAGADRQQTTNAALGGRIDGLVVLDRTVTVDMLAVKGTAHGATARVRLAFRTTGEARKHVFVAARLQLTRDKPKAPWRVFGYDVRTRTREVGA